MSRLAALLLLVPSLVLAAPFQETQPLNRGAVTGVPTDKAVFPVAPLVLTSTTRYRVTICPAVGATLTGGFVRIHIYNPSLGRWSSDSNLDFYVATTGFAVGLCQHKAYVLDVRYGSMYPATQNITASSGTTVTVRVDPDVYGL